MNVHHLTANAHSLRPLVRTDADRFALLDILRRRHGARLLAYCVMDTHLHLLAEGAALDLARRLTVALGLYTRGFNRRHGEAGRLLRGPVATIRKGDAEQLATALHYLHENPLRTRVSVLERQVDYPWSSARAFGGLSLARTACVERARKLLGPLQGRALRALASPPLADLTPSAAPPLVPLPAIVGAAAAAFEVPVGDLSSGAFSREGREGGASSRAGALRPDLKAARTVAVRLARLEGFRIGDVAPYLGRSIAQASRIGADRATGDAAVRVARTLLRDPHLRRTVRSAAPSEPRAAHARAGRS